MPIQSISKALFRRGRLGNSPAVLSLLASLATSMSAWGTEIYGQIFGPDGKPVKANTKIEINGKPAGQTDASGSYLLALPPGKYDMTVGGKPASLEVPPQDTKRDVRLK